MADHTKLGKPSLWLPESDPVILAVLGKASEESAELINICCRAIIQGLNGQDPVTNVPNLVAIQDEVADMQAQINLLKKYLFLDENYINERAEAKYNHKNEWYEGLENYKTY